MSYKVLILARCTSMSGVACAMQVAEFDQKFQAEQAVAAAAELNKTVDWSTVKAVILNPEWRTPT